MDGIKNKLNIISSNVLDRLDANTNADKYTKSGTVADYKINGAK